MTRDAVFVLLVWSSLGRGQPVTTSATVALVPHFEKPFGRETLHQLVPMIAEVFRPAGLSLEWYENQRAPPVNPSRTLDVWFHGNCLPMPRMSWGSPVNSLRLGWVFSRQGRIADEIHIDCGVVMQLAANSQTGIANRPLLGLVFQRLLEHVVAHELLHVLLMSGNHGASEFSRPHMDSSDWRRVGHLTDAEVQLLRQLYRPDAPVVWTQNR